MTATANKAGSIADLRNSQVHPARSQTLLDLAVLLCLSSRGKLTELGTVAFGPVS